MTPNRPTTPKLVPELDVSDLEASVAFYTSACGFRVGYRRHEEQFAYLERGDAHLMLQSAHGPGRRFTTAALEKPYGRGVSFQIEVENVRAVYDHLSRGGAQIVVPIEECTYATPAGHVRNLQFVAADPDGYLLRFFEDLGVCPQVDLLDVNEATLARLVEVAVRDAAADEVTPRTDGESPGWSAARVAWLEAFHRDRRDGLEGPVGERTFAVCVAGEVVGSIRLRRTSERSLEVGIWLRRDARGSGIGAAAVAEALRKARTSGFETVTAQTTANNAAAIGLLRSAGFRASARTDGTVEAEVHLGATSEPDHPHHAPGDGHRA